MSRVDLNTLASSTGLSRDGKSSPQPSECTCALVHGVLVSDEEAAELARRLRAYNDPNGVGVAERLERGLLAGVAIVGTSRPEAEVVVRVIDEWTPERLREVAASLREFVERAA